MAVIFVEGRAAGPISARAGARKARAAGRIPAVVYGHGETPEPVEHQAPAISSWRCCSTRAANAIVSLALDPGEFTTLIRDVQYDPA